MRCTSLFLVSAIVCPIAACDRAGERSAESDPVSPAFSGHVNGVWGNVVSIDPLGSLLLNTPALEGCPNESPDGRSLFFASDRDGQIDIWVSNRHGNGGWGAPEKLPSPVNSAANDFCPTALPGGALLFVSTRSDGANCGVGTADIYETQLDPARGWRDPEHLGARSTARATSSRPRTSPQEGAFSSSRVTALAGTPSTSATATPMERGNRRRRCRSSTSPASSPSGRT